MRTLRSKSGKRCTGISVVIDVTDAAIVKLAAVAYAVFVEALTFLSRKYLLLKSEVFACALHFISFFFSSNPRFKCIFLES